MHTMRRIWSRALAGALVMTLVCQGGMAAAQDDSDVAALNPVQGLVQLQPQRDPAGDWETVTCALTVDAPGGAN